MKDYLQPKDVAKIFGVTTQTIKHWSNQGKIETQRTLGGHRRIPASEVDRLKGLLNVKGL